MYSPKTARVLRSAASVGLPVNPMNAVLQGASRRLRARPSVKLDWVMRFIGNDDRKDLSRLPAIGCEGRAEDVPVLVRAFGMGVVGEARGLPDDDVGSDEGFAVEQAVDVGARWPGSS